MSIGTVTERPNESVKTTEVVFGSAVVPVEQADVTGTTIQMTSIIASNFLNNLISPYQSLINITKPIFSITCGNGGSNTTVRMAIPYEFSPSTPNIIYPDLVSL
jgi:hypothetical protein